MTPQDLRAIAQRAVELCKTGPQPGELTTIGEYDHATEWSSTCLRWRHVRNGSHVKEDFARFDDDYRYDETLEEGHSSEAHFHIFARDNMATLATALLAAMDENERLRSDLAAARALVAECADAWERIKECEYSGFDSKDVNVLSRLRTFTEDR